MGQRQPEEVFEDRLQARDGPRIQKVLRCQTKGFQIVLGEVTPSQGEVRAEIPKDVCHL